MNIIDKARSDGDGKFDAEFLAPLRTESLSFVLIDNRATLRYIEDVEFCIGVFVKEGGKTKNYFILNFGEDGVDSFDRCGNSDEVTNEAAAILNKAIIHWLAGDLC